MARSRKELKRLRLDFVKASLVAGYTDPEIVDFLAEGIPDQKGAVIKCSRATAYRDLAELGERWRSLQDDPEVIEREVYAIKARILRIAVEAAEKALAKDAKGGSGFLSVALRAEERLLQIVGMRSLRWKQDRELTAEDASKATPEAKAAAADARRLANMDDAALLEELQTRRERTAHLTVHEGGKAAGGEG